MTDTKALKENLICGLALLCVVMAMALTASSFAHYCPLNDDWNYARTVNELLSDGKLMVTCWTLAASLTNYAIGWIFCLPFGFSFAALRLSSLFMAWLAGISIYRIMRNNQAGVYLAAVSPLVLLVNPLFFELANTFMTDVPFVGLLLLFNLAALSTFKDLPVRGLVLTTLTAIALVLSRQVGLAFVIAFSISAFLVNKRSPASLLKAAMPSVIAIGAVVVFQIWLKATFGELASYRVENMFVRTKLASSILLQVLLFMLNILRAQFYAGLFLLPALFVYLPAILGAVDKARRVFFMLLIGEVAALSVGACFYANSFMPLCDNVLFNYGLGPIFSGQRSGALDWPQAPHWFWMSITVLSAISGSALFAALIVKLLNLRDHLREKLPLSSETVAVFALLQLALYMTIECFRGFFDRYLIVTVPLYLMLLQSMVPPGYRLSSDRLKSVIPASLAIAIYAAFSVSGTHDYLAYNKAKWRALNYLTDELKISPMNIDGGLEFNGWYGYAREYRDKGVVFDPGMKHGDEYVVALSNFPDYKVVRTVKFVRWLSPGIGTVHALKRTSEKLPADKTEQKTETSGKSTPKEK